MSPAAARVSIGLLALAAALGGTAWRVQSEAAILLEAAVEVQETALPPAASAVPSLREYREVVGALEESIVLRGRIDTLLSRVDDLTVTLQDRQGDAASVAEQAERQLEEIGAHLGAARLAAGDSGERLEALVGRLETARRLARLIAEELEELDRRLGPTLGVGS